MKSQMSFSKVSFSETIAKCLWEPGEFTCKLYRTDGIVQESAIEQLFANFYRLEPYEFMTISTHEDELSNIDTYFANHKTEFENHIRDQHNQKQSKLRLMKDCGDYCICEFLKVISDCIEEFANTVRLNMIVNEDLEIIEKMTSTYSDYTKFVVLLENQLPSISLLISKIPSEGYPFSLWKFLHEQFIGHILMPMEEQLVEAFVKIVGKIRQENIKVSTQRGKELPLEYYDLMFQLREIASIFASKSIDERSVHFLESTESKYNKISCKVVEELIKFQTRDIYAEWNTENNWKRILSNDIKLLERILLAVELKNVAEDCVEVAKKGRACAVQVDCKLEVLHLKDKEVEMYAKRLGIFVNT